MKKKIYISILTTILCFPIFMWTPLANTVSQSYTTGYGSYYFTYNNDLDTFLLTLGNLGGVNMKGYCQSLIYEFNDTYSGYLDIHLMSDSIWNNATIITENCYVKGKNSAQHDYSIGFKDVSSIKVTVVLPTLTTNNAWSGNKMALTTNYNITRDITSVEDYLEDIQTTLGQIDAQLGTMTTSLSNIYGVENASRQLLAEIEYAIRGNNSLYVLADDMGTIITDLNTIISSTASILQVTQNIENDLVVLNDNIEQFNYSRSLIYQLVQNNNRYTKVNSSYLYGDVYTYNTANNSADTSWTNNFYIPGGTTYSFVIYTVNSLALTDVNYYSTTTSYTTALNLRQQTHSRCLYEITVTNNSGTRQAFSIEFNKNFYLVPIYLGYRGNMPIELQELLNISVGDPYTRKMDEIKNAIQNMAVNVNNLTVNATGITYNVNNTEVNNSINNYNTNINQVYNIENNISADFDTYNQQFTPDFSTSLTALQDTSTMMNGIISQINGIQLFTVPILLTLAGIVLLAILG